MLEIYIYIYIQGGKRPAHLRQRIDGAGIGGLDQGRRGERSPAGTNGDILTGTLQQPRGSLRILARIILRPTRRGGPFGGDGS